VPEFGSFDQGVSKEEALDMLKTQADLLKNQLENMQTRIQDLENKKGVN
jgi:prefoldin subunit 5